MTTATDVERAIKRLETMGIVIQYQLSRPGDGTEHWCLTSDAQGHEDVRGAKAAMRYVDAVRASIR